MPGHPRLWLGCKQDVDARDKRGHDAAFEIKKKGEAKCLP